MRSNIDNRTLFIIEFFFLLGVVCGAIVGAYYTSGDLSEYVESLASGTFSLSGFFSLFWTSARFQLATLFLATSYLGLFLLPILAAFRGYLIACTAGALMAALPQNGFLVALVVLGISGLISLPCFFYFATQSFKASRTLLSSGGTGTVRSMFPAAFRVFIITLTLLAFAALLDELLIPRLLSGII